MNRRELRRIAFEEAAAILRQSMDLVDLSPTLSEEDEQWVREYIRDEITVRLEANGSKGGAS